MEEAPWIYQNKESAELHEMFGGWTVLHCTLKATADGTDHGPILARRFAHVMFVERKGSWYRMKKELEKVDPVD